MSFDLLSLSIYPLDACITQGEYTDKRSLYCVSGFIYKKDNKAYLVTSLNAVIGRDIVTGEFKNKNFYIPDILQTQILLYDDQRKIVKSRIQLILNLYDDENNPTWYIHPKYKRMIDIAVFELDLSVDNLVALTDVCLVNEPKSDKVSVVGYPLFPMVEEDTSKPVLKNGSIVAENKDKFFLAGIDRVGMSGSPVFSSIESENPWSFLGVYSGKTFSNVNMNIENEPVWKSKFIDEIIEAQQKDLSYE